MKKTRAATGELTAKQLSYVWLETLAEVRGGFIAPLRAKDYGQFKHVITRTPKGKAGEVVQYVLRNWIEFVKEVEAKAGVKSTPSEPNLDFLLKHIEIAANLLPSPKPQVKTKDVAPVVLQDQPVQLISQDEIDDPPIKSLAELQAILDADGD